MWKLWTQTVLAPVVSSILFIVVFGLSLGGRISEIGGVPYEVFIVPGLIAMAMVQAAYNNNSSSIFQARSDRYINDVLSAPMHPWQMNLGFTVGGVARALAIGARAHRARAPAHRRRPGGARSCSRVASCSRSCCSARSARSSGSSPRRFDHTTFISNIVILPLAFLGGVFYCVELLPSPWEELSHVNPLFYVVEAVRYGFLGTSDVSPWLSLGVTAALAVPAYAWAQWLFTSGRRLKP